MLRLHQQCSNVHVMRPKKRSLKMFPSYRAGQSFPPTKHKRVNIAAGARSSNVQHAATSLPLQRKACCTSLLDRAQQSIWNKISKCTLIARSKCQTDSGLVRWISCTPPHTHTVRRTKNPLEPSVCPGHTRTDPKSFFF